MDPRISPIMVFLLENGAQTLWKGKGNDPIGDTPNHGAMGGSHHPQKPAVKIAATKVLRG